MHFRVMALGAGVQSSALYLMMAAREIPSVDVAIFADTKEEPAWVYENLTFLKSTAGPPIVSVSIGKLGDDLVHGIDGLPRSISIPAFLAGTSERGGIARRQCTKEYKIIPIEREIRRLLGLPFGRPLAADQSVIETFGLSFDEPMRVDKVKSRFCGRRGWTCDFPLFDEFITRADCVAWLKKRYPDREFWPSSCVFCPFHDDARWLQLKTHDSKGWERAIEIDRSLRDPLSVCSRGFDGEQYLHRSRKPLELVELKPSSPDDQRRLSFSQMDCEGMCGV